MLSLPCPMLPTLMSERAGPDMGQPPARNTEGLDNHAVPSPHTPTRFDSSIPSVADDAVARPKRWIRFDDTVYFDPAVTALSDDAFRAWMNANFRSTNLRPVRGVPNTYWAQVNP